MNTRPSRQNTRTRRDSNAARIGELPMWNRADQFVDVALDLFDEHGFDGTTIETGRSWSSFYNEVYNPAQGDALLQSICTAAKADNIIV